MTTDKNKRLFHVTAEDFKKIPGSPIAYWISEKMRRIFSEGHVLENISPVKKGIDTGENALFLREWHEVSYRQLSKMDSCAKWFFYIKGGEYRKWYGNISLVVNWQNDGYAIRHHRSSTIRNQAYFRKKAITWSLTGTKGFAARFIPENCMFDNNGSSVFPNDDLIPFIISYLNTNIVAECLKCLNPTIAFQVGDIANIPILHSVIDDKCSKSCIATSKTDWNSYETSWDFQNNPLIDAQKRCEKQGKIHSAYLQLREEWHKSCEEMRRLEVDNNRIFIEAYGLQNELSPEVPWNEITLTCNPWYRYGKSPKTVCRDGEELLESTSDLPVSDNWGIEHGGRIIVMLPVVRMRSRSMPFNQDLETRLLSDTVKEFISYAVGCMMGRYSPEKPGLILADQGSTLDDYLNIMGNRDAKLASGESYSETTTSLVAEPYPINECCGFQYHQIIDFDGVLPILDEEWFADDIVTQFRKFVSFIFGEENLTANLRFIENVLGKDIRKYFVKDFYKDLVQRYKNRPIYWLFSSPKGSFNALIYLHRYTPDTVSIVLNEYLREQMTKIRTRIEHLERENNRADLGNAEKARNLKKIDKYTAQLTELEDYERDILFPLAQQKIAIDLDDGVKVNYIKFGPALKKISGLEAKEE